LGLFPEQTARGCRIHHRTLLYRDSRRDTWDISWLIPQPLMSSEYKFIQEESNRF
jgi:hypothetical protein